MDHFTITPTVDATQEFIEIANDFSNPLDLVREAISNAYDAGATDIEIAFDVVKEYGESILRISVADNGAGMSGKQLQNFFDLGIRPVETTSMPSEKKGMVQRSTSIAQN